MQRKIKIFIVEDNEDERLFLKEGFIHSGLYEITGEAENGDEMLGLLRLSPSSLPDVILSDLNMPVRNGYEVITDIKTISSLSHIAVIILTTAPLSPYAERCKKLGACAYYTKPDTFLEYKEFAEKIYDDVKACITNRRLEYRSLKKSVSTHMESTGRLTKRFYDSVQAMLHNKPHQWLDIVLRRMPQKSFLLVGG
jgi:CheY-like chemotaxis protein